MKRADRVFATSTAIIGLTTAVLPHVGGYGTVVFQIIVLGAGNILAHFTSGLFADQHEGIVWAIALVLNMSAFLIVAAPLWAVLRSRAPKAAPVTIICWSVVYIALLFVLFPATTGP